MHIYMPKEEKEQRPDGSKPHGAVMAATV